MKILAFGQIAMVALMLVFAVVSQNNCTLGGPDFATVTHSMPGCEDMAMDATEQGHKSATHAQPETCHFGCVSLAAQLGPVAPGTGVVAATYRIARILPLSGIDDIPQTPPPRFG
jgi:gamma-glutamyltranspeptidase